MSTGLGLRICKRRKELGLSQEELAARMGLKSKSTICKIERGDDNLTTDTIRKYADALYTTPATLMGWDNVYIDPVSGYPETVYDDTEPKEDPEIEEAKRLYELYEQAPPEIQAAVETLLRASRSDS